MGHINILRAQTQAQRRWNTSTSRLTGRNNEGYFKTKKATKLVKSMIAFCEQQGKRMHMVRFVWDGQQVWPKDSPESFELEDEDI